MNATNSLKVKIVLVATIFLWASAFVGIRIGLEGYSPGSLALLRFIVASLSMSIMYHAYGLAGSIPWKERIQLLVAGVAGIGIYNICLNMGELSVSAGIASFVIGLMPVMTVFLSLLFLNERLNWKAWLGVIVSLLGLSILALGESSQSDMRLGVMLILVSALMGAILTIVQKNLLKKYHPVAITAWVMWGGTLFLLMFSKDLVNEIPEADWLSTSSAIYMGIFPAAIAYLAWSYVLKNLSAAKASITLYGLPLASTILGFLCLNERPSMISIIGGAIALVGAFIAHRYQKHLTAPVAEKAILA